MGPCLCLALEYLLLLPVSQEFDWSFLPLYDWSWYLGGQRFPVWSLLHAACLCFLKDALLKSRRTSEGHMPFIPAMFRPSQEKWGFKAKVENVWNPMRLLQCIGFLQWVYVRQKFTILKLQFESLCKMDQCKTFRADCFQGCFSLCLVVGCALSWVMILLLSFLFKSVQCPGVSL